MPETTILFFDQNKEQNPDDFIKWRHSNATKAFLNSLLAELRITQTALLRDEVISPEQVAGYNYNQGVMVTYETIINKISQEAPPAPDPEEIFPQTDDLPGFS